MSLWKPVPDPAKITRARAAAGHTVTSLAGAANVSPSTVSDLENGRRSRYDPRTLITLAKIAAVLQIGIDDLCRDEEAVVS